MLLKVFVSVFLISSVSASSLLEYDGWLHISLYHAIDKDQPNKFTPRGNVTVSSLNSGSFTMVQEPLSNNERLKMKKLAESDGIYRLRAVVSGQDGEELNFLTYTRACALAASQLADILWVSLNHVGQVLAVTQTIAGSGNCPDGTQFQQTEALEEFNTNVYIKHTELAPVSLNFHFKGFVQEIGPISVLRPHLNSFTYLLDKYVGVLFETDCVEPPNPNSVPFFEWEIIRISVEATLNSHNWAGQRLLTTDFVRNNSKEGVTNPDTVSFIQKMEREREARERGDVKDNRGFLAKYWMYLVPVVVLVLLSGASNPEGAGGGAR